jgi:hypothetical protein
LLVSLLVAAALGAIPSPSEACVNLCTEAPWKPAELLTPEVPADRGPLMLLVRGCETPELTDVAVTLVGPSGAVAGKLKQIEQLPALPKSSVPPFGRDGRIVIGFVPDAPLDVGSTYTLTAKPVDADAQATTVSFVATAALGAVAAPTVEAKVVPKLLPTRVCCQGGAGCGGDDPDPYPEPAPVVDTVEPPPIGQFCETVATTAVPEVNVAFAFPTPKLYADYRLFDDKDKLLAYFASRRLDTGFHAMRVAEGETRCFRLEAEDRLSGAKASTTTCAGPAHVEPAVTTQCDTIDRPRFEQCDLKNAPIFSAVCDGAAGAPGAGDGDAGSGGDPRTGDAGGGGAPPSGAGTAGAAATPASSASADDGGCQVRGLGATGGGLAAAGLALLATGGLALRRRRTRDPRLVKKSD